LTCPPHGRVQAVSSLVPGPGPGRGRRRHPAATAAGGGRPATVRTGKLSARAGPPIVCRPARHALAGIVALHFIPEGPLHGPPARAASRLRTHLSL